MTRELTSHRVNGVNDLLKIEVVDEPGAGGGHHKYHVTTTVGNAIGTLIQFQNGPLGEYPNGLTNEALLAIVEHRLFCYQRGMYACEENEMALSAVRLAMSALHMRTKGRLSRGVEGTMNP